MKKTMLSLMLCLILLVTTINLVSATSYIYQQNTDVNIKIPVFNSDNSKATIATSCYASIKKPNENVLADDVTMSFNTGGYFNYTIDSSSLDVLGEYPVSIRCDDGTNYGFTTFTFEITPSGFTGTLGFFIIILLLSAGVIVLGFAMKDAPITILGSFGLYFLGIYIMFYGMAGIKDGVTTFALSIIILGLAAYISIRSAYELIVD